MSRLQLREMPIRLTSLGDTKDQDQALILSDGVQDHVVVTRVHPAQFRMAFEALGFRPTGILLQEIVPTGDSGLDMEGQREVFVLCRWRVGNTVHHDSAPALALSGLPGDRLLAGGLETRQSDPARVGPVAIFPRPQEAAIAPQIRHRDDSGDVPAATADQDGFARFDHVLQQVRERSCVARAALRAILLPTFFPIGGRQRGAARGQDARQDEEEARKPSPPCFSPNSAV